MSIYVEKGKAKWLAELQGLSSYAPSKRAAFGAMVEEVLLSSFSFSFMGVFIGSGIFITALISVVGWSAQIGIPLILATLVSFGCAGTRAQILAGLAPASAEEIDILLDITRPEIQAQIIPLLQANNLTKARIQNIMRIDDEWTEAERLDDISQYFMDRSIVPPNDPADMETLYLSHQSQEILLTRLVQAQENRSPSEKVICSLPEMEELSSQPNLKAMRDQVQSNQ